MNTFVDVAHMEVLALQADERSVCIGILAKWHGRSPEHIAFAHADAQEHMQMGGGGQGDVLEGAHLSMRSVRWPGVKDIMVRTVDMAR